MTKSSPRQTKDMLTIFNRLYKTLIIKFLHQPNPTLQPSPSTKPPTLYLLILTPTTNQTTNRQHLVQLPAALLAHKSYLRTLPKTKTCIRTTPRVPRLSSPSRFVIKELNRSDQSRLSCWLLIVKADVLILRKKWRC